MSQEWVMIGAFLLSGGAAVGTVAWLIQDNFRKVEKTISEALNNQALDVDAKIGKVWERFDTYKTTCDGTFVRQQTCHLIHNGTERALTEINRRQESMDKKLDAMLMYFVEKKV
jgi:hypothetical protein